jgi:hypothetical protein
MNIFETNNKNKIKGIRIVLLYVALIIAMVFYLSNR